MPYPWEAVLDCKKDGDPKPKLSNILLVLRNHPAWQGVWGFNSFTERAIVCSRPPYAPETPSPWTLRQVRDLDDSLTNDWLQCTYAFDTSTGVVAEAVQVLAHAAPFHPVQTYLQGLTWDKKARIDTWLETYAHTTPPADAMDDDARKNHLRYQRAVGAKTLIAAVARILQPGCQVDTMTILEGHQGTRKSSAWRVLAGGEDWFFDGLRDIGSKDADEALLGKWIVEFPELSVFSRAEVEHIKQFISKRENEFRLPYGRRSAQHKRGNVFVGSTNNFHWAKDSTGNRRFWPIRVYGDINLEGLIRDRNQLWAEAVVRYTAGEDWYLSQDLEELASQEQKERLEPDDWEDRILVWLDGPDAKKLCDSRKRQYVTTLTLMTEVLSIDKATDQSQVATKRLGGILRRNGWVPGWVRPNPGAGKFRAWILSPVGTGGTGSPKDVCQDNPHKTNTGTGGTGGTGNLLNTLGEPVFSSSPDTLDDDEKCAHRECWRKGVPPVPPVPDHRTSATTPQTAGTGSLKNGVPPVPGTCFTCKGTTMWRGDQGQFVCQACHPHPATEREVFEI